MRSHKSCNIPQAMHPPLGNECGKVLLIWPKADKGFYDFDPLNALFGSKGQFVPLPLLAVAASMGVQWNYRLKDENRAKIRDRDLKWADFVLISANTLQCASATLLAQRALALGKKVIVGGPLLSTNPGLLPDGVIRVIGETEALCKSDSGGRTVGEALSSDMRTGVLQMQYCADGHPDMQAVGPARYDLADLGSYYNVSLQTSRGCPHRCDFCQLPVLYGKHQRKSTATILEELSMLEASGGNRTVYIIDDNFTGAHGSATSRAKLMDLLHAIGVWQADHGYPFDFFAQCSLDIAEYPAVLEAMARIGVNILFVGVETTDPVTLQNVHKNQNVVSDGSSQKGDIIDAQVQKIEVLRSFGMGVFAGLMFGFDRDNRESAQRQVEFMRRSHIPVAGVTVLQAPPGTTLYKELAQQGRINDDPRALTRPFGTNVKLALPLKEFYDLFGSTMEQMYDPQSYFERALAWTEKWNDSFVLPDRQGSIRGNRSLLRIARSLWIQAVRSPYRKQYRRYLSTVWNRFRTDKVRLSLALYLGFFYEVMFDNLRATQAFMKQMCADQANGR